MAMLVRSHAMTGVGMGAAGGVRGAPPKESKKEEMEKEKAEAAAADKKYLDARPVPSDYHGWRASYVALGDVVYRFISTADFEAFILGVICVACLMIGIQTYDGMDAKDNAGVAIADNCILLIFTGEVLLKVVAESVRPWMYINFSNPSWRWNLFDVTVVVLCAPFLPLGSSAAALRLLRLLRLAKLVEKIPKLRALIAGLVGGMTEIAYISILIFLIFYLYAILGIEFFRDNDPWHFRDFFFTMVTLFRMATLEDWTNVFYINFYGCDVFTDTGLYIQPNATCAVVQDCDKFLPDGPGNFSDPLVTPDSCLINASLPRTAENVLQSCYWPAERICTSPAPSMAFSSFYFITYITISALVMLSMFVGAISISMSESVKAINEEKAEEDKRKRYEKTLAIKSRRDSIETPGRNKEPAVVMLPLKEVNKRRRMGAILRTAWDGETHDYVEAKERTYVRQQFGILTKMCSRITKGKRFNNMIIGIILFTGLTVGFSTSKILMRQPNFVNFIDGWNNFITVVFTIEAALKILAEGLEPWRYLWTPGKGVVGWNLFDFGIVVGTWLPGSGSLIMILRLLRLLLVLKLVKSFPQLRLAVEALIGGIAAMGYIGLMLFVVFYFFAIFGGILFAKNDPWHFGNLHMSMLTLFRMATMEDWTDVMYINMFGCKEYVFSCSSQPTPRPTHTPRRLSLRAFISCSPSLPPLSSFRYGYTPIDGMSCTQSHASGYLAVFYSVAFIVIGSLVMLNLFIGVITTSMEATMEDMEREAAMERKVQVMVARYHLSSKTVKLYREVFDMLDLDGDEDLTLVELKIGLNSAGVHPSDEELQHVMEAVDPDGSGMVDYAEFVQFLAEVQMGEGNDARDGKLGNGFDEEGSDSQAKGAERMKKQTQRRKERASLEGDLAVPARRGSSNGAATNAAVAELQKVRSELEEQKAVSARQSNTLQRLRKELQQARGLLERHQIIPAGAALGGEGEMTAFHDAESGGAEGDAPVSLRQLSQREVWDSFVQNNGSKVLV